METKTDSFNDKLTKIRNKLPEAHPQYAEFGKLPPQAVALEEAVLGALMLEKDALTQVLDIIVTPEIFYKEEHKVIWSAILSLFQKNQPVDILTVTNELRATGKLEFVGGPYYISELTNRVGTSANIEFHVRLLIEKFILRELIRISSGIQEEAFEDTTDVFDLLDLAERELFDISVGTLKGDYKKMSTLISDTLENIVKLRDPDTKKQLAVYSGFKDLDHIANGWRASDFIIIASRPGMGKTSFILSLARNVAVNDKKAVAIFSLEMSAEQLVIRLLSAEAQLDQKRLRNGELEDYEWQQLHTKIDKLSEAEIYIDDSPGINIFELRAKCRRLKMKSDIGLVIVDYLQLMNAHTDNRRNSNREQEISTISRSLKGMAKELGVPVIALSQLSREVERRGGVKKPMLSDLRESGSIEQDADQVIFIYRAEAYGLTEDEDGAPTKGTADIIIAKNRHGTVDSVKMKFIGKYTKFDNLDAYDLPVDQDGTITKPSSFNGVEHNDDTDHFKDDNVNF